MSHDPLENVVKFKGKGLLIELPPEADLLPTKRLRRSKDFARTWHAWFKERRWRQVYSPTSRLWMVIWYRSREGAKPVTLTQEIADQAVVSRRRCCRYVRRLENLKIVRVERSGQSSLTVYPLAQLPLPS